MPTSVDEKNGTIWTIILLKAQNRQKYCCPTFQCKREYHPRKGQVSK